MSGNWHLMSRFQSRIAFLSDLRGGRRSWLVGHQPESIHARINKRWDAIVTSDWQNQAGNTTVIHSAVAKSCFSYEKRVIHGGAGGSRYAEVIQSGSKKARR